LNFVRQPTSKVATVKSTIQGLIMRRLIAASLAGAALTFAVSGGPLLAADDPTVHQIYEAAESGHLDQAQQMMNQVLRDHPGSAKAHYVQSELYAREGKFALARSELNRAEEIAPGLPNENPQSVRALKSELGIGARTPSERPYGINPAAAQARFPWATVLILALVVGVFWMLFRRRRTYVQYPTSGTPGAAPGGYGPGYGPGGYTGPGPMGGGIGSSVAGGLAGGLAAGAGIVAGEELAHHFLDGSRPEGGVVPPANAGEWNKEAPNSDMGGADFGVNDPGSWDDGGGSDFGGGGGDDWT
jgi:hypothetical protein